MLSESHLLVVDVILTVLIAVLTIRLVYLHLPSLHPARRALAWSQPRKLLSDLLSPAPDQAVMQLGGNRSWICFTLAFGACFLWVGIFRDLLSALLVN